MKFNDGKKKTSDEKNLYAGHQKDQKEGVQHDSGRLRLIPQNYDEQLYYPIVEPQLKLTQ